MTRFFVRHPVTTWMLFTAFVVLGIYALPRLKIEAMPEVDLPSLSVFTGWTGASPKSVQREITLPVEEAVRKVKGVESVTSISRVGQSVVEVEFNRDIDLDFARLNVNEQLGAVRRNLPLNATQPQIVAYVPEEVQTEEFFVFSLASELSPNELRDRAETWILPQLLGIEGVADAEVRGGARPLLKILLDRTKLELYGIGADEVFAAVDQLDELAGAGAIRQDGVQKLVALRSPVDVNNIRDAVIARRGGRDYTLGMLGEVRPDFEDPFYFVRSNGNNVVDITVEKNSGDNTVTVSRALKKALPEIMAAAPFSAGFEVEVDQGKDLENKLKDLVYRSFIILGVLFILLAVSLRQIRLTAIVIGSIVFSIVICLSLFYFFKLSVNFITISGLTISFGLLLDNSILVLDSIHRRLEGLERADEAGLSHASKLKVAARTIVAGTGEVIFPILATTLTTMVAFLSFIFLSGRLALFYVPLAISVAMAMGASLFVAFGWIPMVLNQGWARGVVRRSADGPRTVDDPDELTSFADDVPNLEAEPGRFERLMGVTQQLWFVIVPLVLVLFWWSWTVYDQKVVKEGWWRVPDQEELFVFLRMPAGTDLELTSLTLARFEEVLMPVPEGARARTRVMDSIAWIQIEFEEELLSTEIPVLYRAKLVDVADQTAGASVFIRGFADTPYVRGNFGGGTGNSLVEISGYNTRKLNEIADVNLQRLQRQRRVRNARISTTAGFERGLPEETVLNLDREKLADYGLTVIEVVGYVRRLLGVDIPWTMLIEGEQERVQLAFEDAEEIEYSDLGATLIQTRSGEKVRLVDLVSMETIPVPGNIRRENQRYSVFLNWEFVGTDRMRKAYMKTVLDGLDLPYGFEAEEAEREFFTPEEEEELSLTLILAGVFIFMVMAALFESISLPLLVTLAIPMGLVGVVLTYWQTNTSFDSSARIGLVLLFGIVVNNAILLASRFRHEAGLVLRAKLGGDPDAEAALFGGQRKELGGTDLWLLPGDERATLLRRAVARGVKIRLRSILLTSGTTMVGLAPLLFDFLSFVENTGDGQEIWENLALSSIGGLASSTILILLAIPPMYYFGVRSCWLWRRFVGFMRRLGGRARRSFSREMPPSAVDLPETAV